METSSHPHPVYPDACDLCCYFMLPEDAQKATTMSPGIGMVCDECSAHIVHGIQLLWETKRIGWHMIEDGERNDIFPPAFLRRRQP